jgi:hypothetical protein
MKNMNTRSSISTTRFQDRPLNSVARMVTPYSLTSTVRDDAWEVVVRFLLITCLLSSMVICGLSLSHFSQSAGTASSIASITAPVNPAQTPSAAAAAVCSATGSQKAGTVRTPAVL